MLEKLTEFFKSLRRFRGLNAFLIGFTIGFGGILYCSLTKVERTNYVSAFGNTIIYNLQDICLSTVNSLLFTTTAGRSLRMGTIDIDTKRYCNQEQYHVSGIFNDSEVGYPQNICSGVFSASINDYSSYVVFDLRYNQTTGCPDNGIVSGLTLYKRITMLQEILLRIKGMI